MKLCNKWECSVKFKCSTVVVNILKTPVQSPNVQSPSVQASRVQVRKVQAFQTSRVQVSRVQLSRRPESIPLNVQCPSVQSSSVKGSRVQESRRPEHASRVQFFRYIFKSYDRESQTSFDFYEFLFT